MNYFIGWDVGGWNCDKNPNSRDAIVVLKEEEGKLETQETKFRGNIRAAINDCSTLFDILNKVCETKIEPNDKLTIAIDTPLGFPQAVGDLLSNKFVTNAISDDYSENPYLYRKTELWLFQKGFAPLSAIKDMIGSQATKGMHLLRKLGLVAKECGVWTAGNVTAIESYPSPCTRSQQLARTFASLKGPFVTQDRVDAVYCGLVAWLFATRKVDLIPPDDNPPLSEGWIWVPRDVIEN